MTAPSSTERNLERAARQALLVAGLSAAVRSAGTGPFAQRQAFGRTNTGALRLLVILWGLQWIWIGFDYASGGPAYSNPAPVWAEVVVGTVVSTIVAVLLWLFLVCAINRWDRAHGRPQQWRGHYATLAEIHAAKAQLAAQLHQAHASLPYDALEAVGYGYGVSLGLDMATLGEFPARWEALEQAEAALRSGQRWWITDGPAEPSSAPNHTRRQGRTQRHASRRRVKTIPPPATSSGDR